VGLKSLSARALAENFTVGELGGAISEAHRRGVNVYVAANSLVKEGEMREALTLLNAAAGEGPDAFIVQDLGLAGLCRRFFPEIPLHASTLAAVHTVEGLAVLEALGFERAVLPRETGYRELEHMAFGGPIDVEIFVHGALCFSFSGLCLFSSFLGGRSALRGACTQPCRRAYANMGRRDTFFSAADFQAAQYVRDLMRLPVRAYKIEGRMKGPDYVERAVKAYRLLIDNAAGDFEGALEAAAALLDDAPQRRRCGGFVRGAPQFHDASMFSGSSVSGVRIGRLRPRDGGWSAVLLERPLRIRDRLRAVGARGGEGVSFKLGEMRLADAGARGAASAGGAGPAGGGGIADAADSGRYAADVPHDAADVPRDAADVPRDGDGVSRGAEGVPRGAEGVPRDSAVVPHDAEAGALLPADASPGDDLKAAPAGAEVEIFIGGKEGFAGAGILYRTGSSAEEKAWTAGGTVRAVLNAASKAPKRLPKLPAGIEAALKPRAGGAGRQGRGRGPASKIWYWLEDAKDIRAVAPLSPARVILPLNAYNVKEIGKRRVKGLVRTVWSLPPLVYPPEGPRLRTLASQLMGKGFGEFMCATLSGAALVMEAAGERTPQIYADHRMGFLNRFAADALHSVGIDAACVSAEVDAETWNRLRDATCRGKTLCYLSGRPALFTSRMVPAVKRGAVESPRGERFWAARDGEAFVLLPEARVFMGGFLKGPELPNLAGYIVDLRREKDPGTAAMSMRKAAAEGRRAAGTGFNFKRGLG
jgi:putative protease